MACDLWFEGLGGNPSENVKALIARLDALENVNSPLAMQVRRVQEQILEKEQERQRTGELKPIPTDTTGLILECQKVLGITR